MTRNNHCYSSSKSAIDIRILTHNIRYATESPFRGEELWKVRCPRLCSELVFNSAEPSTFICLQEVLHSQLLDVHSALNGSKTSDGEWAYIGIGRDDGKEAGEYSPIFYRPSIWQLKSWETKWLSPTPNVPSKGWDAGNPRIVTIGLFIHVESGRKVSVLCTHLDNEGSRSRRESVKIILEAIGSLTMCEDPSTILLAGDFNSPPDDDAYQIMTSPDSSMEDICLQMPESKRYGDEMTFTSFGYVDNDPVRIDFIFSRKGDRVTYRSYAVLANRFDDGVYLSDHRACVADVVLQTT
ncbi:hypothetical protein LZ554_000576 [Drepanopeziza brunnea f. sp. 'monogermtubi']|nr:hypothetical protein LZ554_000576 [Drepanopeziza brunnea f. sp. 'monogermtubi']